MPETAGRYDGQTLMRIEEGSLRIVFSGAPENEAYREEIRMYVGDLIRSYFRVEEYRTYEFQVCMRSAITMPEYNQQRAKWRRPDLNQKGLPIILPAVGSFAACRCGLKVLRDGEEVNDLHEAAVEYFEAGLQQPPPRAVKGPKKEVPVAFDADLMQKFINVCVKELELGAQLSIAALERIYGSVRGNLSKDEVKRHVAALVDRGFFVHQPNTELRLYDFGPASKVYLPTEEEELELEDTVEVDSETVLNPNLDLARRATERAEELAAQLQAETARADEAEAKLAEAKACKEELERELSRRNTRSQSISAQLAELQERIADL